MKFVESRKIIPMEVYSFKQIIVYFLARKLAKRLNSHFVHSSFLCGGFHSPPPGSLSLFPFPPHSLPLFRSFSTFRPTFNLLPASCSPLPYWLSGEAQKRDVKQKKNSIRPLSKCNHEQILPYLLLQIKCKRNTSRETINKFRWRNKKFVLPSHNAT